MKPYRQSFETYNQKISPKIDATTECESLSRSPSYEKKISTNSRHLFHFALSQRPFLKKLKKKIKKVGEQITLTIIKSLVYETSKKHNAKMQLPRT